MHTGWSRHRLLTHDWPLLCAVPGHPEPSRPAPSCNKEHEQQETRGRWTSASLGSRDCCEPRGAPPTPPEEVPPCSLPRAPLQGSWLGELMGDVWAICAAAKRGTGPWEGGKGHSRLSPKPRKSLQDGPLPESLGGVPVAPSARVGRCHGRTRCSSEVGRQGWAWSPAPVPKH